MGATSGRAGKRPAHRCSECGWTSPQWVGRCGECQAWGTVEAVGAPRLATVVAGPVTEPARPIREVDVEAARARPTGFDELDRVLGGGLVPGAVVLLTGEPGVGKSTLLLEAAARGARADAPALYVTGEESAAQVRLRAERVGAVADHLYLAAETDLAAVVAHVETVSPGLLVVDSVQTIGSPDVEGGVGGVAQVREVAAALIRVAKTRQLATVLVGHVTKDGSIAGPRTLEHLVDVVIHVEGDRYGRLRLVRALKNRYGPADEVGCFELADDGIWGVADPSGLFVTRREHPVPGTCVTVTVEGNRPLLAEVQALVSGEVAGSPRRATSGLDSSRVAMVLAVLEKRAGVALARADTYLATVGGVRLGEPATDLAVALSVASAARELPLWHGLVAVGEVGLAGDVRPVVGTARRLAEAARLGFTRAVVPAEAGPVPEGMRVQEVRSVREAIDTVLRVT